VNDLALFAGAGGGILGGHLLGWRTRCAVELIPTLEASCSLDSEMASYPDFRSGMTLEPSTVTPGEGRSMSFPAAFPAKTSVCLEREQASEAKRADYGARWHGSFARFCPVSFSWKIAQYSLLGGLASYSETWPRWGTMRDGACWERTTLLEPLTKGIGSGCLLPTLSVVDWSPTKGQIYQTKNKTIRLRRKDGRTSRIGLAHHLGEKHHPNYLEWMMAWPINWTDLDVLGMDRFQQWRRLHGKY